MGLAALALPMPAFGHGRSTEAELFSFATETRLRQIETGALGAGHAADHAVARSRRRAALLAGRAVSAPVARTAKAIPPGAALRDGVWGRPFDIPVMGIHAVLMPTGKFLYFSYPRNPNPAKNPSADAAPNESMAWVWDPAKGTGAVAWKRVDPPVLDATGRPANIWCAGQTLLADGRVVVVGGNLAYEGTPGNPEAFKGLNRIYLFDPFSETWQEQPRMNDGRWYPTVVRLADSRVLITGGLDATGLYASPFSRDIEVFTPGVGGAPGSVSLLGKRAPGSLSTPTEPPNGGLYPHQFLLPDGRVVHLGPFVDDSWIFTAPGTSLAWSDLPNLPQRRMWGNAVLLPTTPGAPPSSQVLMIGGSDTPESPPAGYTAPATTSTMTIDPSSSPTWTPSTSLNVGRGHGSAVLLPDGSIAEVGGGYGVKVDDLWAAGPEHKAVEIRDPRTGAWQLGAAQAENRAYHSTALLMPDGRVISAGDDANGGIDIDTAEIYAPAYLFKGPRPTIRSVPGSVRLAARVKVVASGAIERAVLIAPGAVTHGVDMNQRYVPLAMKRTPTGVEVTMPANPNAAPPGYYMLFLMSPDGVPSVARFIRLDPNAPARPPAAPLTPILPPGGALSPGPTTPPKALSSIFSVRLVAPRAVRSNRRFTVTVVVDKAAPRSTVLIQRKVGVRFRTIGTTSFSRTRVRVPVALAAAGPVVIRVVVSRPGADAQTARARLAVSP